jgi:hypothetical protein
MINFNTETTETGSNQYLLHSSASIEDNAGMIIGEIIFTRYDAERAELDCASSRFIARPDTYLDTISQAIFDPESSVARLPAIIRNDLPRGSGKIIIIDDIMIDEQTTPEESMSILCRIFIEFHHQSDLIVIPNWTELGRRMGIAPVEFLRKVQPFGIVPTNVHHLIGFCDDFGVHLANEASREVR